MEIFTSPRFKRSFKKMPKVMQEQVWKKIQIFEASPFYPALRVHKLTVGELWAFSIDHKNRIIFQFLNNNSVVFVNIGDHSIYRKIS